MNPIFSLEHLVLVVAAAIITAAICAWRTSAKCKLSIRLLIVVARLLGIACLAVIAFNPGRWQEVREDRASEWAILVDRSLSMSTTDANGKMRWTEACRLAQKAVSFATDPGDVRIYTFADQLESVPDGDVSSLKPDGESTDILQAGRTVLSRARSGGKRLMGMILISDGRQIEPTRHDDLGIRARSQESPIFSLALGGEVGRKDLSVKPGRKQYVAFLEQKLKISALVKNEGLGNISPTVRLFDSAGRKLLEQKIDIPEGETAIALFEISPKKRGYYEYMLKVPTWENESTESNNETSVGVTVLGSSMRVLMAEGTPYWDSKFLIQLLRKQPNMEVTSVYRLSSERFFKVETDSLSTFESSDSIFPDDSTSLSMYDVIVFGKGVEYFLTLERIKILRDFVRNQGGCIIFSRGKPYNGVFPELESLEPAAWGRSMESKFRFRPTSTGEDVGLFGEMLAGRNDPIWQKLPLLQYAHRYAKLKAFTQVLVDGVIESGGKSRSFPVVISRRYGKGIVVVVNADGLWQWDFFSSVSEASNIYKEFWTQLLQWAVTYSEFLPGQEYSLRLSESSVFPDTPVRVRINCRGAYEKKPAPVLRIMRAKELVQELVAISDTRAANSWDAVFSVKKPGVYYIELATTQDISAQGPRAVLRVKPDPTEMDNLSADLAFLRNLAEESGGRIITEDGLEQTIRELDPVTEVVDIGKAVWMPLWDKWWCLCVMLLFFGVEWFARRRNGLL